MLHLDIRSPSATSRPLLALRAMLQRMVAAVAHAPWIVGLWAGQRVCFLVLTWLVQRFTHPYYLAGPVSWQSLFIPWGAWDGGAYLDISQHGYTQLGSAAYSPLFPFLLWLTRAVPYHQFIVPSLAELPALYLLYDYARHRFDSTVAHRVVLFVAWAPFAAFYSAEYTESLFLLCSVGVFWALQRDRVLLAGLCAAAATLTRQYGILLCLPLLTALSWRRIVASLLPVSALAASWWWVSWQLHVPFAPLASAQGVYSRRIAWPWQGIVDTLTFNGGPHSFFLLDHRVVDLLLVVVGLALAVALARFPVGEKAFVWATVLVILCLPVHVTPTANIDALASAPRYLAVLFPLSFPLALWAHSKLRERVVMWTILLTGIYLTALLAAGIWIG